VGELITFVGEACVAIARLLIGKARFRSFDFKLFLQESGAQALPIVSLISALVGLILAFVGIIQLKLFGAQIYVADLVGIAMVREMGAIMTGIIMAGRTGAAFAAQLGTMQVNEEIDALTTLGIAPMEFLVLPRMIALTLMMPLLCLYANVMGILGGMVVAIGLYDINTITYLNRTIEAVGLNDLGIGLFMSLDSVDAVLPLSAEQRHPRSSQALWPLSWRRPLLQLCVMSLVFRPFVIRAIENSYVKPSRNE
jgi:phospholipid/cholesterol/gamma-HCH transport system permease protein